MSNDLPYYETFYGIYIGHWMWSYGGAGGIVDSHYTLVKEYINDGCYTEDLTACSSGSSTFVLFYPHFIKKQFYIQGVAEGQFTVACMGDNETFNTYMVRLMKIDSTGNTTEIGTTGYIDMASYALNWDSTLNVGDELVVPFYITISNEVPMYDLERLYLEITVNATDVYMVLYHSNNQTWEDIKISIPFRGI